MTQKESDHLRHLLTAFDAKSLGQGDALVGTNLLAAMACNLSNLARPGSGILTPEGTLLPVGSHLLASGPLLTSLVLDAVVTPIGCRQSNLLRQLSRLLKNDKAEAERNAKGFSRRWSLSDEPGTNESGQALFNLMTGSSDSGLFSGAPEDEWACVVAESPVEGLMDLVRRPRSFIAAFTLKQLEQQLSGAHRGEALVALGLNRNGDAAKFGELIPALMDGLVPGGPSGETVRGRLLVTVPERILREDATASGDRTTWLARLLWLVEGEAGPGLPSLPARHGDIITLPQLETRFRRAVEKLFGNRLNEDKAAPVIMKAEIWNSQCRWVEELRDMEKVLPGISGTARSLLASLTFGLHQMVRTAKVPEGFRYYQAGINAFARFLVRRMANYRAALLFSADEEWRLKLKRKIFAKLADGRLDTRTIYRHLGLSAALCEDLLWEMQGDRKVSRHGRKWERVKGASLPDEPTGHLPFEV